MQRHLPNNSQGCCGLKFTTEKVVKQWLRSTFNGGVKCKTICLIVLFSSFMDINLNTVPHIMRLNEEEHQVLILISEGLTAKEIGDKLTLSLMQVNNHRKSLLSKTKARNTAALITFAFRFGLLKT